MDQNLRKIVYRGKKAIRNTKNKFKNSEEVFTEIYEKNLWSGISKSGTGSDLVATETIRNELPKLLQKLRISSILDIPCGDFFWMKRMELGSIHYIGGDIVSELIKTNNTKYATEKRKFLILDIMHDSLPKVDLVLCRDLFVHMSYKEIFSSVENLKKSGSGYLLTTSFTDCKKNKNITKGDWRPINLTYAPFNFPSPLHVINENYSENGKKFLDKSLCLWNISDL